MSNNSFEIKPKLTVGTKQLLLISGPCQIESYEHCMKIAEQLIKICAKFSVNLVFKASYDKANRTSISGVRGPGCEAGLKILERVKSSSGLAVLTDVHSPEEAHMAGQVVDILQIPAFLCRQTDLLVAAGESGKTVNIKKGQFLAPEDMQHAAAKVSSTGNHKVLLCERGTCFGYRDLVVDMRSLIIMKEIGFPVIYDATHSVQIMGGSGGSSAGQPRFILLLARAAVATGVDGIFVECHEQPQRAPSDAASMLRLDLMESFLESILVIHNK